MRSVEAVTSVGSGTEASASSGVSAEAVLTGVGLGSHIATFLLLDLEVVVANFGGPLVHIFMRVSL